MAILAFILLTLAATVGASEAAGSATRPPEAKSPAADRSTAVEVSPVQRMPGAILFGTVIEELDDPAILTRPGL
jgi:hypothetical protein